MKIDKDTASKLTQAKRVAKQVEHTVWQYSCERLRVWVADDAPGSDSPSPAIIRPYLMLLVEVYPRGSVIRFRYAQPASRPPDAGAVLGFVADQILQPTGSTAQERPDTVAFVDERLVGDLATPMRGLAIKTIHLTKADGVQEFVMKYSERLVRQDQAAVSDSSNHPGLLSVAGVGPELVDEVFKACAGLQAVLPWKVLMEHVALRVERDAETRYLTILGSSGKGYGVTSVQSLRALRRKYRQAMGVFNPDKESSTDFLCGMCGREPAVGETGIRCAGCRAIQYCTEKCRQNDWLLRHHSECPKIQDGELDLLTRKKWARRDWTVLFSEKTAVPFDDLDAAEDHGWVCGPDPDRPWFIPFVTVSSPGFPPKLERPSANELTLMRDIAIALAQVNETPTPGSLLASTADVRISWGADCR